VLRNKNKSNRILRDRNRCICRVKTDWI